MPPPTTQDNSTGSRVPFGRCTIKKQLVYCVTAYVLWRDGACQAGHDGVLHMHPSPQQCMHSSSYHAVLQSCSAHAVLMQCSCIAISMLCLSQAVLVRLWGVVWRSCVGDAHTHLVCEDQAWQHCCTTRIIHDHCGVGYTGWHRWFCCWHHASIRPREISLHFALCTAL